MSDPQNPPGDQAPGNQPPAGPPPYQPPPPPPGGGYGPPPPPPGGGYGPPPGHAGGPPPYGAPEQLRVGAAVSYGWQKFKANWGVWVVITLVFFLIESAIGGVGSASQAGGEEAWDASRWVAAGTFSVVAMLVNLLNVLVTWVMQAAQTKGALAETEGRKPDIGDFFEWGDRAGAVVLTFLLLTVLTFVGFVACVLPAIVFTFFAWYTLWFVLDKGQSPLDALKSSFRLVADNLGPVFLLALALIGINILGLLACCVGLLVTVPVTLIATGYSYKFLTHQPIS